MQTSFKSETEESLNKIAAEQTILHNKISLTISDRKLKDDKNKKDDKDTITDNKKKEHRRVFNQESKEKRSASSGKSENFQEIVQ